MPGLIERIQLGMTIEETGPTTFVAHLTDDAVEAWTTLYGEPPTDASFTRVVTDAIEAYMRVHGH